MILLHTRNACGGIPATGDARVSRSAPEATTHGRGTSLAVWVGRTGHTNDPKEGPVAQEAVDLVKAVKTHALANYEKGGWDVIVECWEDAQIAEHIEGATSVDEALAKFRDLIEVWTDHQAEADSHREG